MHTLSEEERKRLIAALRDRSDDWLPERLRKDVRGEAADEIERLEKCVAELKSDIEDMRYWENVCD